MYVGSNSNEVKWVEVHYTDLRGRLHSVCVTYERVVKGDVFFDGSSVDLLDISDSDLHLVPDMKTLAKLPWGEDKGRVFADIWMNGSPFWGNSRGVARKASEYLRDHGFSELMGAEVEFFIHKVKFKVGKGVLYARVINDEEPPMWGLPSKRSYEVTDSVSTVASIRWSIVRALNEMGVKASIHHHEVAPNQAEISTPSLNAIDLGDAVLTIKYVAKHVAREWGYVANFMPKPIFGDNGSGMHVHISLWRDGVNVFSDDSDPAGISQLCRYFIGGLLDHGRSLAAIVSPTTNSYKRLVPGYEAPIYLAWGVANRSAAVRVPRAPTSRKRRIEFRPPDPMANPYLAAAAILAAGIDGIRRKIDPGDPIQRSLYSMSEAELRELGVKTLPKSLSEALDELESDHEYLRPVFPKELIERYLDLKREEIRRVEVYPTPAEFMEYLW